jgi:hypothetical protein
MTRENLQSIFEVTEKTTPSLNQKSIPKSENDLVNQEVGGKNESQTFNRIRNYFLNRDADNIPLPDESQSKP